MTLQRHRKGISFPSPGTKMLPNAGENGVRGEADFVLTLLNKCLTFCLLVYVILCVHETIRFFAVFKMSPFILFQLPNSLMSTVWKHRVYLHILHMKCSKWVYNPESCPSSKSFRDVRYKVSPLHVVGSSSLWSISFSVRQWFGISKNVFIICLV
jgi:hypothetical protein